MIYVLRAKVVEVIKNPIEVEADSLEEAKDKIEDAISCGKITIEPEQTINVEFEVDCASFFGHRWDLSHEGGALFCKHCGMLKEDYSVIEI